MSNLIIGCGYNPCFFAKTLRVPDEATWMELGIKQYLEMQNKSINENLNVSLHIARSPITENKSSQNAYISYLSSLIKSNKNSNLNLSSIGFHLSGSRYSGIGRLGFTSHYKPTTNNKQRAIEFIRMSQYELHTQIWIENANFYSDSTSETIAMWQSVSEICHATKCGLIVDLSHVFIDFSNMAIDPITILGLVPWDYIKEIHLSGIIKGYDGIYHDGHSQPVSEEVWQLFIKVWELLTLKNICPIVTIEHTDIAWGQKQSKYQQDFQRLQSIISKLNMTPESKSIDSGYYASRYVYKHIKDKYALLIEFMKKINIDVFQVVDEWINDLKSRNLRLTFDINEVSPDERMHTIEYSDFVYFVEKKYVVRN